MYFSVWTSAFVQRWSWRQWVLLTGQGKRDLNQSGANTVFCMVAVMLNKFPTPISQVDRQTESERKRGWGWDGGNSQTE